jgi:hypothetical protein
MAVAANYSGTAEAAVAPGSSSADLTTLAVASSATNCLFGILLLNTDNTSVTTMNWDQDGTPQAMTLVSELWVGGGTSVYIGIFRRLAPTTGTLKLHAAWSSASGGRIGAVNFSGVDQTTPVVIADNANATDSGDTSASLAVTSGTNDATLVAVGSINVSGSSTDTQTEIFLVNPSGVITAASYGLGGTTNTHTWTVSGTGSRLLLGIHISAATVTSSAALMGQILT